MAVAFDAKTVWGDSAGTSITLSLTLGASANGILVHVLTASGSALPAGLTVKWDTAGANQSFTQVSGTLVSQASMASAAALYGLIAPGSSGTKNITVAWTSAAEVHACAISFTGVDQTSVAVAFPHGNTNQANAGTSPCTVTITSATGNMVTASHAQNSSTWGAVSGTTLAASDLTGPSIGVISNYDNGAASVTLTAAFPTTPSDRMSIGCDVLAAAAGGPAAATPLLCRPIAFRPYANAPFRKPFPPASVDTNPPPQLPATVAGILEDPIQFKPFARAPFLNRLPLPGAPPTANIQSGTWSAAGAANDAIWTGAVVGVGTWSAVGTGAANWVGAAIGAGTWASSGIGAAPWVGAATAASTWSSTGVGAATWVGTGVLDGVWSSAGSGAATWVGIGISIQAGVWSSAGTGAAAWTGASIFSGVWNAAGVGAATWTGASTAAAVWGAAGLGDAPWVGSTSSSIQSGVWSSTGTGGASWTGAANVAGVWGATGLGAAAWTGTSFSTQGALSAGGTGAALWVGIDATPQAFPGLRWNLERAGWPKRRRKPTLLEILADIIEEDPPPKVAPTNRRQKARARAQAQRWAEEIVGRAQREARSYELNYAKATIDTALREHAASLIEAANQRRLDQEEEEAIVLLLSHYY